MMRVYNLYKDRKALIIALLLKSFVHHLGTPSFRLDGSFFLATLGLRCCAQVFSSCGEQGLLFTAVRGLLIVVPSLVMEHGL